MKCKTNKPIRVRIGSASSCIFKELVPGVVYDLPKEVVHGRGLITVTEGKSGKKKVETKQFQEDNSYKEKLRSIKGIGPKTVKDILKIYPTRADLKNGIQDGLPFDDDIEKKLGEEKW